MSLTSVALVRFKEGVSDLVRRSPGYSPDGPFGFIVLDPGEDASSRVPFPGYGRPVVRFIPGLLPFLGSPVAAVAVVPEGRRKELSGVNPDDVPDLLESDSRYAGDVVLMYAAKALPAGFAGLSAAEQRVALEPLVRSDVRQLDLYGVLPVTLEDVPGIAGCLPEFVNPSSDRNLAGILRVFRRTAVGLSSGSGR